MTYKETLELLLRLGETRMRLDLQTTEAMLNALGNPDRGMKSVIVAGTNGKGSTTAYMTAIARAAGIRVGTFTSPHLESPTERIAVDGEPLSEQRFAQLATEVMAVVATKGLPEPTYFELVTAMAILAFASAQTQLNIFEVGLGGRLDSTNAIDRIGAALTSIDYDHTKILGSTLSDIASEKAAIFRNGLPAVVADQPPEAREQIVNVATRVGAMMVLAGRDFKGEGTDRAFRFQMGRVSFGPIKLGLKGKHQVENAACAAALALSLSPEGLRITPEAVCLGLATASLPGRLELWRTADDREVWLDTAHNPEAARSVAEFFSDQKASSFDLVVGMLAEKDWRFSIEPLLPLATTVTLCKPDSPRAWNVEEVAAYLEGSGRSIGVIQDPAEAVLSRLECSSRVLCTGSFYVVGKVRAMLRKQGLTLVSG